MTIAFNFAYTRPRFERRVFLFGDLSYAMSRPSAHRITIRLKPEEYAQIVAKAGDVPLAAFVRQTVLEKASKKRANPVRQPKIETKQAAMLLARLGQHELVLGFKAAARDTEIGIVDANEETQQKIADCHAMLRGIRSMLMEALGRGGV